MLQKLPTITKIHEHLHIVTNACSRRDTEIIFLHANCSSLDDRVSGDKIDYIYHYHYHDSTEFKM